MKHKILVAAGLAAAFSVSAIALAQQPPAVTPMTPEMNPSYSFARPEADYVRREVMIPMRDGAKLFTVIAMYKGTRNAPILLSRTPYNAGRATARLGSQRLVDILPVMDAEFVAVADGFAHAALSASRQRSRLDEAGRRRP